MKQSKSLAWLILLFSVSLLAAGCSGKTKLKGELGIKGAPDWVNKGTNIINDKKGRLFHGVGSAPPLGDDSLQVSTADDRARAEVARVLSSYMDVVSNDYLASTNTGSGSEAEQAVTRHRSENPAADHAAGAVAIYSLNRESHDGGQVAAAAQGCQANLQQASKADSRPTLN